MYICWFLICFAAVYMLGPVTTWMGDCLQRGSQEQVLGQLGEHPEQLAPPTHSPCGNLWKPGLSNVPYVTTESEVHGWRDEMMSVCECVDNEVTFDVVEA